VKTAPLNVLHIHGDKIDLPRFQQGWPASAINYSPRATKIPVSRLRSNYSGVILAGIDEVDYRKLPVDELKKQHQAAIREAGKRLILTPGCSVPDETTDEEMLRLTRALGA
jgi:hypothetical protein